MSGPCAPWRPSEGEGPAWMDAHCGAAPARCPEGHAHGRGSWASECQAWVEAAGAAR